MKLRIIKNIIPSRKINMGGHILEQPLPNHKVEQVDPFLLIHHAEFVYEGNQRSKDVGIGGHPHRGFSPVTFIFQGDVRHQDSFGNDVVVKAGGTQWMHAGKGIVHSERPSEELAQKGGMQEMIQFWVNTPAKYKMEKAYYLPLSEEDTPSINGEGYTVGVVAGKYENVIGPAKTFSPMVLLRGKVDADSLVEIKTNPNYNTLVYLLDGQVEINGETSYRKDLIHFSNEGDLIRIKAQKDTRFILLSGEPIGEDVTSYGPFVMNTQTEILEAMRDAQMGKMGVLIEND